MPWTLTTDLAAFVERALPPLRARPERNTLMLSVAATLARRGATAYGPHPPRYGWWQGADGGIEGALLWTPPHPVQLSPMPGEAARRLPESLAPHRPTQLHGDREAVGPWLAARPGAAVVEEQRLYRLGRLTPPRPLPRGRARTATAEDRSLLVDWCVRFSGELGQTTSGAEALVDDRLSYQGFTLWQVDGEPVAMAGAKPPIARVTCVAPVYTPPPHRRRGYAAAVTAAVSGAALGAGPVVLFADAANRTSTALYERLGYRPLAELVRVRL
ncbi:GNAT family N-acetyltransferase [Streptomyces sp. NPDC005438]|uniref:GNAT family N-acetyltransferase n=1 Tax=Streptomyces sp. NPDC005438 TaxID=3156880 RepID=UPI0033AFCEB6